MRIVVENAGKNWSCYSPDIDGVIAADESKEKTVKLFLEAVEFHLEGMREDGDEVPGLDLDNIEVVEG